MVLIAKRDWVVGALGVTVSISLRQDARGAIPRGAIPQGRYTAHIPSYYSISVGTPVSAQKAGDIEEGEIGSKCEQSFATTTDTGDLFLVLQDDSVVVLDTEPRPTLRAPLGWHTIIGSWKSAGSLG